jgi:Domain of unknown function (DUF6431)
MDDDRGLRHDGGQDRAGRRKLGCPDCGQPLRPWGHARERTIRDTGGTLVTIRPDRALCTGCGASHVVLDAGLLPRRACTADLIGQALVASALGRGHRLAAEQAQPQYEVHGQPGRQRPQPHLPRQPVRHRLIHQIRRDHPGQHPDPSPGKNPPPGRQPPPRHGTMNRQPRRPHRSQLRTRYTP